LLQLNEEFSEKELQHQNRFADMQVKFVEQSVSFKRRKVQFREQEASFERQKLKFDEYMATAPKLFQGGRLAKERRAMIVSHNFQKKRFTRLMGELENKLEKQMQRCNEVVHKI
jgi:hypothetical protein